MRSLIITFSQTLYKGLQQHLAKAAAILALSFTVINPALAQQKHFVIKGKVTGSQKFKYVLVFDHNHKFLKREDIIDGKYELQAGYFYSSKFQDIPDIRLLLSNTAADTATENFSNRRNFYARLIVADTIQANFDSDSRIFQVEGGMHNFVQNQFLNTFSEYGRKRDSTYLVLDQSNLSAEDKEKEKLAAAKNLALIGSKKRMKIVSENLDSEVSLNNFSSFQYEGRIPGEEVLALYNSLSIPLKNSFYGLHVQKSILTEIKSRKSIPTQPYTLGMKMPDFSLENHKGNLINARDEYKKYTLIDFWATWCGPCRVETPNLIAAHKKFKDHGFSVITVSIDEKNKYKTWLAAIDSDQMGLFTNLLYDTTKSTIVKELQINAIPANYLVDSTGTIVAVNLRGEELVKTLNKLLK